MTTTLPPQELKIFGMSAERLHTIFQKVKGQKSSSRTPILDACTAAFKAEETRKPPTRLTATAPPSPAAAGQTLATEARALAIAILDEQDRRHAASLTKSRAAFTAMKPAEQMKFVKAGGKLVS
ncbi:MAG: hypothetical protein NTW21_43935 [Verrucomicrobia bacterium]|nr:hypothetical protein [Verrucomicrobiota bacterium]